MHTLLTLTHADVFTVGGLSVDSRPDQFLFLGNRPWQKIPPRVVFVLSVNCPRLGSVFVSGQPTSVLKNRPREKNPSSGSVCTVGKLSSVDVDVTDRFCFWATYLGSEKPTSAKNPFSGNVCTVGKLSSVDVHVTSTVITELGI